MTDGFSDVLLSLLRTRRSIRRFRSDPVPEEMITRLVEAATWAPSAGNRQAWRLVVVRTPECIAKMGAVVREEVPRLRQHLRNEGADVSGYFGNLHHFDGAPVVLAPFHRPGVSLSEAVVEAERRRAGATACHHTQPSG
jgi:5,6-dimethylbenzimidazole synthase